MELTALGYLYIFDLLDWWSVQAKSFIETKQPLKNSELEQREVGFFFWWGLLGWGGGGGARSITKFLTCLMLLNRIETNLFA